MKKLLLLTLLFPFLLSANSTVFKEYNIKPSFSYSFFSTGTKNYFLQQYTLNIVNKHNEKLKTNMKVSYLRINNSSFVAPELKMTYNLGKNSKLFLNIKVIKHINGNKDIFSPYKSFDDIGQWK